MKKIKDLFLSKIISANLPVWVGPFFLFATCFFVYGVLLARLGFFQDDWHHIYYAFSEGTAGLMRFLFIDSRPLAFTVYVPFFKLLGFVPANWHWSLMILRFLTVLAFWLSVRLVWPTLTGLAAWLALFFALYPAYPLQSLSVAYTLHWFLYLTFMLSVTLMLMAARNRKAYLTYTGIAIFLQMFHLAMIEYYAGLELTRLVFLWFIFRELPFSDRLKKVVKQWLPYLVILVLYAVYRMSYNTLYGYDRFSPTLLLSLIQTPLSGIRTFLQIVLQDTLHVLISPWFTALDPAIIDFSRGSTYQILASIAIFAFSSYFVISRLEKHKIEAADQPAREIVFAGILAVFFALLPSWLAGLFLFSKNPLWSGRLALPALLGAGMILTGLVYWLIEKPSYRHFVLSILLGLAIGFHGITARDFQTSWDKQQQFYWQLRWRAPALQPNTLIVADAEILPFMGYYPTAFAVNVLYGDPATTSLDSSVKQTSPKYWFNAGSEHINWGDFGQDLPSGFFKYSSTFSATRSEVVAITFEPQQQQCLWVLRPEYEEVRFLSAEAYKWMSISNLERISASTDASAGDSLQTNLIPPPAVFGKEPARTWCYYYEKADLASQRSDWENIVRLWEEAQSLGYRPAASIELVPFIKAFALTGDWSTARELTNNASVYPPRAPSMLCSLWKGIETSTQPSDLRDSSITQIKEKLGCQE